MPPASKGVGQFDSGYSDRRTTIYDLPTKNNRQRITNHDLRKTIHQPKHKENEMQSESEDAAVMNVDSSRSLPDSAAGGKSTIGQESAAERKEAAGSGSGTDVANDGGVGKKATSVRRRAASQANGRKSRGPVTEAGKSRSSQNARKPTDRLLGLTEVRTLHHQPGAALKLYREMIAPYEPAPALLARHIQDLARLYLELEALECIRDATLDHRAQQTTIHVRSSYREMDAELGVAPKEVFERGLHDLPDSPAKLKRQVDCLDTLKYHIERRDFDKIGPALRLLYGNELNPKSEEAKLVCIDCQRLMDPESGEPPSDQELSELLSLVDQQQQWAMSGYELELDKRTVTGSAAIARLAPQREDQWMYLQVERLRSAIDRKQWVITGLLQTPSLADRYGSTRSSGEGVGTGAPSGDPLPPGMVPKPKTNPRSALESAKVFENEPDNEPKRTQGDPAIGDATLSESVRAGKAAENEPERTQNEPETNLSFPHPDPFAATPCRSADCARGGRRSRRPRFVSAKLKARLDRVKRPKEHKEAAAGAQVKLPSLKPGCLVFSIICHNGSDRRVHNSNTHGGRRTVGRPARF
jgi:hypothetical protein